MKITFRTFADFREIIGAGELDSSVTSFFIDIQDRLVLCFFHKKEYLVKKTESWIALALANR
jgi:hypothetical protein